MASPFSIFRKHQRVLIATLTILTMFAFVFIPLMMQVWDVGGRQSADPAIIHTTQYGNLTEAQLSRFKGQHTLAVSFLERAMLQAFLPMLGPNGRTEMLRQQIAYSIEAEFGPDTERAAGDRWLQVQRAKELGIVVSDEFLRKYLSDRTNKSLGADQWREILSGMKVGDVKQAEHAVFEALRNELMARLVVQQFAMDSSVSTPAQRWEYFQRLNRRVRAELIPVAVAPFVGKIPDPDQATLQKFFDAHKQTPYDPDLPTPGFRQPYRATVEFLKADFEKFVDPKSVTDEEIAQYYEKNKEQFLEHELPKFDEGTAKPDEKKPDETKPADTKPADEKKADTKKAPEKPVETKPAEKKPESTKPAEKKAAETKPAGGAKLPTLPSATKPVDEKKTDTKKPEEKKPDDKKQSATGRTSPFRFAAMQVEKDGPAAKPQEAAPAKPADAKPAAPQTKSEPKPEVKAEAKPEAKAEAKPEAKAEAKPEEKKPEAKAEEKAPEKPKYQPLEKVKEEIRTSLARQKANDKMMAVLEPLRNEVKRYAAELARKDKNAPAPARPDFEGMAKQQGLTFGRLGMISRWEARDLDIGRSTLVGAQRSFMEYVFAQPGLGRAAISQDEESNKFLFWKTEEQADHVPELSETGIRDQVVRAWKMIEARKKAMEAAEALKTKAAQSTTGLKETFQGQADVTVLDPPAFSWLTYGAIPAMYARTPPRLSPVEGVDAVSTEFMATVFGLEEGKVGIAMNRPETVVYVVRINTFTPAPVVLWESFLVDDFSKYRGAADADRQTFMLAWLNEAKKSAGFEWKREPDARRESSGSAPRGPQPIDFPDF